MNIVFINSHPIQYFAPLYQKMAKDPDIRLKVIYLSDETIKGYKDDQFGVTVKWDIPLLQGYNSLFLKNHSWKPSLKNGFFGLINFGLIRELKKTGKDAIVIVHGWGYFSLVVAVCIAKIFGFQVGLRGESPLKHENLNFSLKGIFRFLFFKIVLLPFVDKFFFIGNQNRMFYKKWGVRDSDLFFTPYSVDNARFRDDFLLHKDKKKAHREMYNIHENAIIILFSGKYINKKRPLDILQAINLLKSRNLFLIMMGEGELRSQMEQYIHENQLSRSVLLTGFINQTEVSKFYALADIFVMCSERGETWGLSVNEAMNFNLPLIISDQTGCSDDLVHPGKNGYVFSTGNVPELVHCMEDFLLKTAKEQEQMGKLSYEIVNEYSFRNIIVSLKSAVLAHV